MTCNGFGASFPGKKTKKFDNFLGLRWPFERIFRICENYGIEIRK